MTRAPALKKKDKSNIAVNVNIQITRQGVNKCPAAQAIARQRQQRVTPGGHYDADTLQDTIQEQCDARFGVQSDLHIITELNFAQSRSLSYYTRHCATQKAHSGSNVAILTN